MEARAEATRAFRVLGGMSSYESFAEALKFKKLSLLHKCLESLKIFTSLYLVRKFKFN